MRRLSTRTGAMFLSLTAALLSGTADRSRADNWPQWRGPAGNGVTAESKVPTEWGKEDHVRWRVPLEERGNSTPVVWDQHIYLTQPDTTAKTRQLRCYDRRDGKLLWSQAVPHEGEESTHETNPYCSASPATDGERVIVWFGSAGLHCYDSTGKKLWDRDLGPQAHMWGYGTSPILHGNLCILNFGPGDHEQLIAVDKKTGETVWSVASMSKDEELALSGTENDGNASDAKSDKPRRELLRGSWGTPTIYSDGQRDLLIVIHPRRVTAYDPATGEIVWVCGGYAPLAYASPISDGKLLLALGGYFGASLAVRSDGSGDVTGTHRLWHKPRDGSWLGTGVAVDGHAYLCDMNGKASCLEMATGKTLWEERLSPSGGKGGTWSSATLTADRLVYWMNQSGDTFVFRANPEKFELISRNSLDEPTNSSVVISGGNVILRTDQALWCIE